MNAITVTTEQPAAIHPIALNFVEGQVVTLLAGAKVHGLITRCNQPGRVVHIQYSDEFGVIYVVAFGKLGMYAYVSADGLEAIAEAVTPLLDVYSEVDAADLMPLALDPLDTLELVGLGDAVEWGYALSAEPREGTVKRIYKAMFLVEFEFGATRWCFADEIKLVLKAAHS